MPDITDLLNRWSTGDGKAFDDLAPLVYHELKSLAQRALFNERYAPTLNCTALVHEAYLRLVDQTRMMWSGRAHFFGAAAQVMRRILVDHARQRLARKRGAGAVHQRLPQHLKNVPREFAELVQKHDAVVRQAHFARPPH